MSSITDKIIPVCKLTDIIERKSVCQTLYVVSDKDNKYTSLVYADDWLNNSDRVRSHFAKYYKMKFTDTRCCRIKNKK